MSVDLHRGMRGAGNGDEETARSGMSAYADSARIVTEGPGGKTYPAGKMRGMKALRHWMRYARAA
jgi:hypothetical protein